MHALLQANQLPDRAPAATQRNWHPSCELTHIPRGEIRLEIEVRRAYIHAISTLKDKCTKSLNLIKVTSHQKWGANRATKIKLYRALIRSKLDYSSILYETACATELKKLDVIQNSALRLSLGAFCTSPISSLEVLANEPPLELRRVKLSMLYTLKARAEKDNPVHNLIYPQKRNGTYITDLSEYHSGIYAAKSKAMRLCGMRHF